MAQLMRQRENAVQITLPVQQNKGLAAPNAAGICAAGFALIFGHVHPALAESLFGGVNIILAQRPQRL